MAGWIKLPLGRETDLSPGVTVLDGDPMAVAKPLDNKMPLGTEVGLGSGHIVLDGTQLPQRDTAPNFWLMSVVAKRLDGSRCHFVRR